MTTTRIGLVKMSTACGLLIEDDFFLQKVRKL